ncbi:MAG: tetratricopeptide repeat protein [Treponema sp.]|nr:tetratricopeptide repeat protein [Treponema sp.]
MKKLTLCMVFFAVLFLSCRTVKDIPDDLSAAQLIQLGQNAYGNAQYKNSEIYYHTVISRYGTDTSIYVEAKYELGHLYMKQKKYDKAYAAFKELLTLYESTQPGVLPGAFNKLSQIEMVKIPEKYLPTTKLAEIKPDIDDMQFESMQTDSVQ